MRPSIRSHRPVATATLSLILLLSGCTYWRVHQPGPAALISARNPEQIQVTRADSMRLTLDRPVVVGDSLVGDSSGTRVAIPLTDVRMVAERRTHLPATIAMAYGISSLAIGILWHASGGLEGGGF